MVCEHTLTSIIILGSPQKHKSRGNRENKRKMEDYPRKIKKKAPASYA